MVVGQCSVTPIAVICETVGDRWKPILIVSSKLWACRFALNFIFARDYKQVA